MASCEFLIGLTMTELFTFNTNLGYLKQEYRSFGYRGYDSKTFGASKHRDMISR
jgi:hypothetical protein